jgi:methionine aminopeptidase
VWKKDCLRLNRRATIVVAAIVVVHFAASVVVGNYVADEITVQLTDAANEALAGAVDGLISGKSRQDIDRGIEESVRGFVPDIAGRYRVVTFVISLPTGPVLRAVWRFAARAFVDLPHEMGRITDSEHTSRLQSLVYVKSGVNSVILGGLLWLAIAAVSKLIRGRRIGPETPAT